MDEKLIKYLGNILLANEYLSRWGYVRSLLEEKVVDADGKPIPWYSYPAIDILKSRSNLLKNLSIFEYGSGNSTLWWSSHSRKVTTIEHDKKWFKKMLPLFPDNVRPIFRELVRGGEYSSMPALLAPIKFDIIIIDGRDRVNCCKRCVAALNDNGVIVLDNSNREEYIAGRDHLKALDFRELQLYGMGPMLPVMENATSFFYRDGNCLGF